MDAKKPSTRAVKTLGISPIDILAQAFTPDAKYCLSSSNFKMFWTTVFGDEKECTNVVNFLLTKIFAFLEKTQEGKDLLNIEVLAQTVTYIVLFQKLKTKDNRIKAFLDKWKGEEMLRDVARPWPCIREAIRMLQLKVEDQDMLGPVIIGASTLHSAAEFHKLSNIVKYPTLVDADLRLSEGAFFYAHLRALAHDKEEPKHLSEVLVAVVNKMLTLPQQMKMNPKVAETTLLALHHMLKQFLSINSVADQQFLKRTMQIIQPFYLWPCPFGTVTRDALVLLSAEMRAPGAAMRARMLQEGKVGVYQVKGKSKRSTGFFIIRDMDNITSQQIASAMSFDGFDPESQPFYDANPEKKKKKEEVKEAEQVAPPPDQMSQALIVINFLHTDPEGLSDADVDVLKGLGDSQMLRIYEEVIALLQRMDALPDQAREIRHKGVAAIRNSIKKLKKEQQQNLLEFPEDWFAGAIPPLPSICHVDVPTRTVGYTFETKDQVALMCLMYLPFPTTPVLQQLTTICRLYTNAPKPLVVRVAIAGSDLLLHSVLCAWLLLQQSTRDVLEGIELKFYVLPFSCNYVSAFLARHDSWYNRHIYVPFRTKAFMVPWVNEGEGDDPAAAARNQTYEYVVLGPSAFLRDNMERYALEAQGEVNLYIYKVEGWIFPPEPQDSCDMVVPFLQRVEIGMQAEAEKLRQNKKLGPDIAVEEIFSRKDFVFNPPDTTIKFTQMDLRGDQKEHEVAEPSQYNTILVANVPRASDQCFPPDPSAPHLEMYAQAQAKQGKANNILSIDPRQHIESVTITSATKAKFEILADGQICGPFCQVRISVCTKKDVNKTLDPVPILFPIQSFFPLDL